MNIDIEVKTMVLDCWISFTGGINLRKIITKPIWDPKFKMFSKLGNQYLGFRSS